MHSSDPKARSAVKVVDLTDKALPSQSFLVESYRLKRKAVVGRLKLVPQDRDLLRKAPNPREDPKPAGRNRKPSQEGTLYERFLKNDQQKKLEKMNRSKLIFTNSSHGSDTSVADCFRDTHFRLTTLHAERPEEPRYPFRSFDTGERQPHSRSIYLTEESPSRRAPHTPVLVDRSFARLYVKMKPVVQQPVAQAAHNKPAEQPPERRKLLGSSQAKRISTLISSICSLSPAAIMLGRSNKR